MLPASVVNGAPGLLEVTYVCFSAEVGAGIGCHQEYAQAWHLDNGLSTMACDLTNSLKCLHQRLLLSLDTRCPVASGPPFKREYFSGV